ncbi:MAG TPA: DHA2 family efflux MFS transporter permease subunit, partial [Dehalococcoidia bacterium]|nr:DHA2 family efflux MFS transporter permease subunit [Dehalococcoidia bacterium]
MPFARPHVEYKWLVGVVYVLALFMDLLDMTVINVAIPTLAREFAAGTTTIEWVVTGYLLSLALFIPVSGWLGDRFGTKRVFLTALSLFIAGSLLCGVAWDIESLIAFRVLQGIGGGMLTPVGMTMLFRAFPPSERAAASAVLAIPITVAPALGPVLGGYLVDYHDWRWIFFINIPIGTIALVAATALLREERQEAAGRLDVPGFALAGAGLVSLMYALAEAGLHGFGDREVLSFGAAGLALLAAFVVVELRAAEPMIDVRLLTDKLFGAANVIQLVGNAAIMGGFFLLPLFLQTQRGQSAFDVGLIIFPMAVGVAVMAQPAARLYPKVGPRRMMLAGFTGQMVMTGALALALPGRRLCKVEAAGRGRLRVVDEQAGEDTRHRERRREDERVMEGRERGSASRRVAKAGAVEVEPVREDGGENRHAEARSHLSADAEQRTGAARRLRADRREGRRLHGHDQEAEEEAADEHVRGDQPIAGSVADERQRAGHDHLAGEPGEHHPPGADLRIEPGGGLGHDGNADGHREDDQAHVEGALAALRLEEERQQEEAAHDRRVADELD